VKLNIYQFSKSSFLKEIFLTLFLISFVFSCSQNNKSKVLDRKSITFKDTIINLGEIPHNKDTSTFFTFKNTSPSPVKIKDIKSSCGCTIPKWYDDEIAPNDEARINVIYNADRPGKFKRDILVVFHGNIAPQRLSIKGEVDYLYLFE